MSSATDRRMPAEWEPHRAVWIAWPSHDELWGEDALIDAQAEVAGLCEAIADADDEGRPRGEVLEILCRTDTDERMARWRLGRSGARFHRALYGDIWLRDTAPIFTRRAGATGAPELEAHVFQFNGWGNKYLLPGDAELASVIAEMSGWPASRHDFVLEGGAIELDGQGTLLTTKQCLLNPNRNPTLSQSDLETRLRAAFGVETILWLDEGLLHDHTDGHVDTIARFVAPGRVVCMAPTDDDPNRDVLETIARDLSTMRDARGRALDVVRVPGPGAVLDEEGDLMPASHVNFYVGNHSVVVPIYGTEHDETVVAALRPLFPGRTVVGRSCRTILEGGGAFHCITQQEPTVG
jgi:agmatine deiminase